MFTGLRIWQISSIILVGLLGTMMAKGGETVLNIGDKAPDINLNDQDGNLWRLKDHLGKSDIVVYFYPAAMSSGCTKQACSYRDSKNALEDLDVVVVGISGDAVSNLKYFQEADHLNFSLLSDVSSSTAKSYGVPIREGGSLVQKINGKEVTLKHSYTLSRWTFIIDKSGKIVYKDKDVNPVEDSQNIVKFLKSTEG